MANSVTEWSELLTSQFVADIQRMESRNIFGYGVVRLYFHSRVNIERALAQVTAVSQTILRKMPLVCGLWVWRGFTLPRISS